MLYTVCEALYDCLDKDNVNWEIFPFGCKVYLNVFGREQINTLDLVE